MKKNIVTGLLVITLVGCAGYADYPDVVKTPAPAEAVGVWMTEGPQNSLVDSQAMATLIVNRAGDTLDCRQWQRSIARQGKLTWRGDELYIVNSKNEYQKVAVSGAELRYGDLNMRRVKQPTVECQAYVKPADGDYIIGEQPSALPVPADAVKSHKKPSGVERTNKKD